LRGFWHALPIDTNAPTPAPPAPDSAAVAPSSAPLISEKDLVGFKYFDAILPLLKRLHGEGCGRDKAHNRTLHFDQYTTLVLVMLFNPIVTSMRGLVQVSSLDKVRKKLGVAPTSLIGNLIPSGLRQRMGGEGLGERGKLRGLPAPRVALDTTRFTIRTLHLRPVRNHCFGPETVPGAVERQYITGLGTGKCRDWQI